MPTDEINTGVVGLGLMGCSITACFLLAGHKTAAVAAVPADMEHARDRILHHLEYARQQGLTDQTPGYYFNRLTLTDDFSALKDCDIISENTLEDIAIKKSVLQKIEQNVADEAIITSNTSAIPISDLQKLVRLPRRLLGLHWMEPAHTTRFLEVICGDESDAALGEYLYELSYKWGKEPTLVRKDIRGFITNRLMYALYREACSLVEKGYASVRDVDRAVKNSTGYWLPLMGPFRWMDMTGIGAYRSVMKDLFPTLSNDTGVPELIDDIIKAGGKGINNGKGFYDYTPDEAQLWKEVLNEFSFKIRDLGMRYPDDIVERRLQNRQTDDEENGKH